MYAGNPELTAQVSDFMNDGLKPANSYRVLLGESGNLVCSPKSTARISAMARIRRALSDSD